MPPVVIFTVVPGVESPVAVAWVEVAVGACFFDEVAHEGLPPHRAVSVTVTTKVPSGMRAQGRIFTHLLTSKSSSCFIRFP